MAKPKFYVVWKGKTPGIYNTWNDCQKQVHGFEGALYKSFETEKAAITALKSNPYSFFSKNKSKQVSQDNAKSENVNWKSIAVDAACSGNPGLMEYRGVDTATGQQLFHQGPFEKATNNIGEFLAIVHGLAMLKKANIDLPLYSDSRNAILWVKKRKCATKLAPSESNKPVFDLIKRAENWLQQNTYSTEILKWDTANWGEIPADFGRK